MVEENASHLLFVQLLTQHSDINSVIMDYLVSEGYPGAAEKFAQETNLFQGDAFDLGSIRERVQIRNAILAGRIEDAVELLNDINIKVCLSPVYLFPNSQDDTSFMHHS